MRASEMQTGHLASVILVHAHHQYLAEIQAFSTITCGKFKYRARITRCISNQHAFDNLHKNILSMLSERYFII